MRLEFGGTLEVRWAQEAGVSSSGRCFASVPALALANDILAGELKGSQAPQPVYRTPATLERYIDPLPIPKQLAPYGIRQGKAQYRIRILETRQKLHSQLPPTTVWGFEGQYPGPTIEALRDRPIEVRWENHLPRGICSRLTAPTWRDAARARGEDGSSSARLTHPVGKRRLPEKWFTRGFGALLLSQRQPPATLWYHDHAVGITRLNVYAGLPDSTCCATTGASMNLPSGDYEIPLLLQDRTLDEQGQLVYAPTNEDGAYASSRHLGSGVFWRTAGCEWRYLSLS